MGTLILHTLTSGCRKLAHPHLRQSSQKQHENAEECSPSACPSPAVPKTSPLASYACCIMRGVQLHLAGCSALRIGRRPRASVTTFVMGTTTNLLTGAKARRPWTPSSLIHTHKHQHLLPLRLRPLQLWPLNLQTPTLSALASSTPGPWTLVLSWSSMAVAQWHDLTMHVKPHYQRFLPGDH